MISSHTLAVLPGFTWVGIGRLESVNFSMTFRMRLLIVFVAGKGFAFVSFEDRAVAQRAIEKMNGRGYDNLILSVGWSRKYSYKFVLADY